MTEDVFPPAPLPLTIGFLGHATMVITYGTTVVHVDPWSQFADYGRLPKADLVLVTHEHPDHLDPKAIAQIRTDSTVVLATARCTDQLKGAVVVMRNGDERSVKGIGIRAVPAYNIVHKRGPGAPYHPKGEGNGYVLTLGSRKLYIAGDTENTPEMKGLTGIDIAFLPMNLPYTMTPEMVADAATAFRPKILYPYHYGETDPARLTSLLAKEKGIEVRIRPMK
jgi:L-ascorbate metabolism protein UlaG (beta-lactamase superfamily)